MHGFHRWREILLSTKDEAEVRHAVRNYAASIPAALFEVLPEECKIALNSDDVQGAAVTLLHAEMRGVIGTPTWQCY